jgi:response regulator RpfG family c-di-GMP phosphodiesterase
MKPRILYVDDDPGILEAYKVRLGQTFDITTAMSGREALDRVRSDGPFEVVLADMRMPGMDGIEVLSAVRELAPDSVRMMLTGNADLTTAIKAVNEGHVFRFLTKPCQADILANALQSGVHIYRLATAERELMSKTLKGSIKVLMDVLAMVSPVTFSRASRLKRYVLHAASELRLEDAWRYELAAMLSQLGCVALDPDTVHKALAGLDLSEDEADAFNAHPSVAEHLLANIPRLEEVTAIVARQHEPFRSGDTNPDPRRRDVVSLGAQLLHAATEFDRLTTNGLSARSAAAQLAGQGDRYDPAIADALGSAEVGTEGHDARSLTVADLQPRMVIARDVRSSDGRLLVTEGQEVTFPVLARLRMWSQRIGVEEPLRVFVPRRVEANTVSVKGEA